MVPWTPGMSGDHTILISKSILDFFTAMIFGGTLGMVVAAVAIPQCVIFLAIFAAAKFIFPLTTPDMMRTSRPAVVFFFWPQVSASQRSTTSRSPI